MRRIRLTVAYDGTNYSGWQAQPNSLTIEEVLNREISGLVGEPVSVIGASRTDAGVHACGNVAVFDTNAQIPGEKFAYAINQRLPLDIRVMKSEECAPDWHPRKADCTKTYEYKIYNERISNPMQRLYSHHCYFPLSLGDMRAAAEYLIGEHDFTSFANPDSQVLREGGSAVREIYDITILVEHSRRYYRAGEHFSVPSVSGHSFAANSSSGQTEEEEQHRGYYGMMTIRISGSGFLYNMVRILAGTLLEAGQGKRDSDSLLRVLESRDRRQAGPTLPGKGLFLLRVEYPQP